MAAPGAKSAVCRLHVVVVDVARTSTGQSSTGRPP